MLDILTSERLFTEAIEELEKARELIASNPQLTAVENVIKSDLNLRIKRLSEAPLPLPFIYDSAFYSQLSALLYFTFSFTFSSPPSTLSPQLDPDP